MMRILQKQRYLLILLTVLALVFSFAAHPVLAAEEYDAAAEVPYSEAAAEEPAPEPAPSAGQEEPAEEEPATAAEAETAGEEAVPEEAEPQEEETAPAVPEETEEEPAGEPSSPETSAAAEDPEPSGEPEPPAESAEGPEADAPAETEEGTAGAEEPAGVPAESGELPAEEEKAGERPASAAEAVPAFAAKEVPAAAAEETPADSGESGDGAGTFADGTYVPSSFTFEGGTGKVTITCPELVIRSGKATATLVFSSSKYTYVLAGGTKYYNENPDGNSTFTVPVSVNAPTEISAETTAMSEAHLVDYTLHVGLAEGSEPVGPDEPEEPAFADGTYVPDFTYEGGTGKVTITCPKLVMKDGKGTATIVFSSTKYTYALVDGERYDNENPGGESTFTIPVNVNAPTDISAETTAMSEAHLVDYTLHVGLAEGAEPEEPAAPEEPEEPETPEEPGTPDDPAGPEDPETPGGQTEPEEPMISEDGVLADGVYRAEVETGQPMFKVVDCVITSEDGKMTAVITLSGTGYDYLYAGSAKDAYAAGGEGWIPFAEDPETGKYTYTLELATVTEPAAVAARSARYASEGRGEAAWIDRTLTFVTDSIVKIADLPEDGQQTDPAGPSGGQGGESAEGGAGKADGSGNKDTEKEEPENTGTQDEEEIRKMEENTKKGTVADGTYVPSFGFTGGTGKVTISCPKLVVKNGKGTATLVFSSSKYTYVLVNGTKYYNENPGGKGTFTIPVNVNTTTLISAETTAMSEAHLIDYVLYIYVDGQDVSNIRPSAAGSSDDAENAEDADQAGTEEEEEEFGPDGRKKNSGWGEYDSIQTKDEPAPAEETGVPATGADGTVPEPEQREQTQKKGFSVWYGVGIGAAVIALAGGGFAAMRKGKKRP